MHSHSYEYIICFCVPGNLVVVIVIAVDNTMHTATNFFLASMSFSDIVFIAFGVPLNIYVLQTQGIWSLGPIFCSLFWYFMYVSYDTHNVSDSSGDSFSILHIVKLQSNLALLIHPNLIIFQDSAF